MEDGAVLLDGGAVDGVLDEEVGVGQRLDLLVVVEVGEDADAQLLVLALHRARQRLLQGRVHVASVAEIGNSGVSHKSLLNRLDDADNSPLDMR